MAKKSLEQKVIALIKEYGLASVDRVVGSIKAYDNYKPRKPKVPATPALEPWQS